MAKKTSGTTKSEPKAKRKMTYEELEKAAGALAGRVIWALSYCKASGFVMNAKTGEVQRWEDTFMDALDMVGHRIDRKAFYAQRGKKGSSRKH
mgnify:CR=1 FL=1